MKFNFKTQNYQTEAVSSVINCFNGTKFVRNISYVRESDQMSLSVRDLQTYVDFSGDSTELKYYDNYYETGFKNKEITLNSDKLLENINKVQRNNNVYISNSLVDNLGACSLDIEMETGTGKTYVYIKTMFELNRKYGWSKFIVVVPSIAIREGVKKSFEMTQEHFMSQYKKKVRYFVYDSKNLNQLDAFSSNSGISCMIINMQAFNSSLKENGRNKDGRIIYSKRDEFGSRRPIDVIKATNPILILDEPQKMGGKATQMALKNFNPLFTLNYSATHTKQNNLIYALDAVDAFNQKLVKKIEVKGFEVKNLRGTDKYLYLDNIIISPNEPPKIKIEFEIAYKKSINRESRILTVNDDLYLISKEMEQYKGYIISDINPIEGIVHFINGKSIRKGEIVGDVSEMDIRRIQIRETIKSHFEKEEYLFDRGIKTLSLFFIDEVSKYRQYDETDAEFLGEYGRIFESEYNDMLNEKINLFETPYQQYLKNIAIENTHKGYFSIDKKGKSINSRIKRGSDVSDDISAYDLILKNKEVLLSFEEPTRFIFSHSALREGWDNPNVFQICTLKHGTSITMKRQEVGRGLRICVDKTGERMDIDRLGPSLVHKVNKLTVIASESYQDFVSDLQKELKEGVYIRPQKASIDYFIGKKIRMNGENYNLSVREATMIYQYLVKNDYISTDGDDLITDRYRIDSKKNELAELPKDLVNIKDSVHKLICNIFRDTDLVDMVDDGHDTKIIENVLNSNFYKKEFQTLWSQINRKYSYTVSFNSEELITKSIKTIDENLYVTTLNYTTSVSEQKDNITVEQINSGESFKHITSRTTNLHKTKTSQIKYDLIGKISSKTLLTRKTVVKILKGIRAEKFSMFRINPEDFISKISELIKEQKSAMIVEHISYNELDGRYDSSIFTSENKSTFENAFKARKHIQPYVFTDGLSDKSVEINFAKDLDSAEEVSVFAKLPRGFSIPTPVGNYSPDWAIAFKEGTVKHIFFIAETKGTMESMQLRAIEKAKISCAKKLFNEMSNTNLVYHEVDSYQRLLELMPSIKKQKKSSI